MDIKELEELLNAIGILTNGVCKNLADGFQANDLVKIGGSVIKNYSAIREGFKGLDKVKEELEDLDPVEAKKLIGKLIDTIYDAKEALDG